MADNNGNVFSPSSGDSTSEIKVHQGHAPSGHPRRGSFLALPQLMVAPGGPWLVIVRLQSPHGILPVFLRCLSSEHVCLRVYISLF